MYWYDGKLIKKDSLELSINEPGLLYGATVFTTMRIYEQSLAHPLTHWQAHCDRLSHSLQRFGWQQPDWQHLQQGAAALLPHFPVLRLVIFADGREWITGRYLPAHLTQLQQQGITVWVAEDSLFCRDLASYKTGNYLGAWLARQQAQKLGAKEAILVDSQGNWLETSTGNLWGWRDGCWWTPALEVGILPGIVRSQLLGWLKQQNIPVQENIWTPNFVAGLEAIAYSNCVVEVIPIFKAIPSSINLQAKFSTPPANQLRTYFTKSHAVHCRRTDEAYKLAGRSSFRAVGDAGKANFRPPSRSRSGGAPINYDKVGQAWTKYPQF